MSTSTFTGVVRSGPKGSGIYAGSALLVAEFSIDPTAVSASTGITLPAGAVITDIISAAGATGGTNPTIDVGTAGTSDEFANELDADANSSALAAGTLGAGALVALSADTEIYAGVGASAATGGATRVKVLYYRQDAKSGINQ